MLGILVLLLFAIGPLVSPDVRSQSWAWLLSGVCWLAIIGLAYGKWRDFQAREAIIELNEREKRRGG